MQKREFLKTLGLAAVGGAVGAVTSKNNAPDIAQDQSDAAFNRVIKTGVLRCSYINYVPYFWVDAKTGQMQGVFYELTKRIAELANLEIVWTPETNFSTLAADLQAGRFDVFCGGLWPEINQSKVLTYSLPSFYSGLGVYVRADDHRFDHNFHKLNNPECKIATLDGEMSQIVQLSDFPKAMVLSLPSSANIADLSLSVYMRKADATIIEKSVANEFMLQHPNSLRDLTNESPIRLFENSFAFAKGEQKLKEMFDVAVKELIFGGTVEKHLQKYEKAKGDFYRLALPYRVTA